MASDAVWLTDLDPLSGYDPLADSSKGSPGKADAKNTSGKSVVKAEFPTTAYGASSLVDIKTDSQADSKKPGGPAVATINAVRIKGFWRETPKSQNVVSELLKNLRDRSTSFRFKVKDAKGAEVPLRDDQILAITVAGKAGDLGLPFEITLPLAKEVVIK